MGFNGNRFTWSNERKGMANVQERLNWALATVEWRIRFQWARVVHDKYLGSDHRPILVFLWPKIKKPHPKIRFDERWLEYDDHVGIVEEA